MVEYVSALDTVFGALSDGTRRDILGRVSKHRLAIGEIAKDYDLTFAAISKHLKVLEKAKLIIKHRHGKQQIVELAPLAFVDIEEYLKQYRQFWENRLDSLESYLIQEKE